MNFAIPLSAHTFVNAAVNVVFPWSTCPIVPMFTCGFFRSYFAFAIGHPSLSLRRTFGGGMSKLIQSKNSHLRPLCRHREQSYSFRVESSPRFMTGHVKRLPRRA